MESGIGHAQRTALKGLRLESPEEAQRYLDRWEEHWADTRIHGTPKRQVGVMSAEEKPHLGEAPLQPFRYYRYGERTVNLDGCAEVGAAFYGAPPGGYEAIVVVSDLAPPAARRSAEAREPFEIEAPARRSSPRRGSARACSPPGRA